MSKIFRLTIGGDYMGQNWNNTFHYLSASNDSVQAANLREAFENDIGPDLVDIWNVDVNWTSIGVVDVPDTGDYSNNTLTATGTFGSTATRLGPGNTCALTISTSGSPIRHGYKRFVGMDEGMMTNGVINSTYNALVGSLCAVLNNVLTLSPYSFTPIIVRYEGDPLVITDYTEVVVAQFRRFGYTKTRQAT